VESHWQKRTIFIYLYFSFEPSVTLQGILLFIEQKKRKLKKLHQVEKL